MLVLPAEDLMQSLIFLPQGHISHRARIAVHAHCYPRLVEAVDRVVSVGLIEIELDVGGWADFQMDLFFSEMLQQGWIFDTAHPMTDARGMQVFQRAPHTLCPKHLASMNCAGNAVLDSILKSRNMSEKT